MGRDAPDLIKPVSLLDKEHELLHRPGEVTTGSALARGTNWHDLKARACRKGDSLQLLSWYIEDETGAEVVEKVSCGCAHDRRAVGFCMFAPSSHLHDDSAVFWIALHGQLEVLIHTHTARTIREFTSARTSLPIPKVSGRARARRCRLFLTRMGGSTALSVSHTPLHLMSICIRNKGAC